MLKRTSEYKRDDYLYSSPDGDSWIITIIQSGDRKYVEIKKENDMEEDEIDKINWDVDMLLDIADAVRQAISLKPVKKSSHKLKQPAITDHRGEPSSKNDISDSLSDKIQSSVEASMENPIDDSFRSPESFSQDRLSSEINSRNTKVVEPSEPKIKRTN